MVDMACETTQTSTCVWRMSPRATIAATKAVTNVLTRLFGLRQQCVDYSGFQGQSCG